MGEDRAFQVVRRIIGPGGCNMKHIAMEAKGSKVKICGRRHWEQDDSIGPLTIEATAMSQPVLESAIDLVKSLLESIHEEYMLFCQERAFVRWRAMKVQSASAHAE